MTDPGAGCGSPTGNTDDAEDRLAFASSDSNWELCTDGTRVTPRRGKQDKTVNYRLGTEDEAAFTTLTATMSVNPNGTNTELCDERTHGIMFMGDDEAACHITQDNGSSAGGGDDKDAAAARFTLIDTLTADDSGIFGIAGDDHIYEGNPRELVAA